MGHPNRTHEVELSGTNGDSRGNFIFSVSWLRTRLMPNLLKAITANTHTHTHMIQPLQLSTPTLMFNVKKYRQILREDCCHNFAFHPFRRAVYCAAHCSSHNLAHFRQQLLRPPANLCHRDDSVVREGHFIVRNGALVVNALPRINNTSSVLLYFSS